MHFVSGQNVRIIVPNNVYHFHQKFKLRSFFLNIDRHVSRYLLRHARLSGESQNSSMHARTTAIDLDISVLRLDTPENALDFIVFRVRRQVTSGIDMHFKAHQAHVLSLILYACAGLLLRVLKAVLALLRGLVNLR